MIDTRNKQTLHWWVLAGIVLGVAFGFIDPSGAARMKPLGDGFIKLIRMVIAPIVFCTVVTGVANVGDMRKLGRVGIKALLYFEVVTTLALCAGLIVVTLVRPGAGMNVNVATLDPKAAFSTPAPAGN